jgi:hypothetical protein
MSLLATPCRSQTPRPPITLLISLVLLTVGISGLISCSAASEVEVVEGRVVSFDWDLVKGATRLNVEIHDGQVLEADVPEDLQRELGRYLTQEGGVQEGEDRVSVQRASSEASWGFVTLIKPTEGS